MSILPFQTSPQNSVSTGKMRILKDAILLNPQAAVCFHWADFHETCATYAHRVQKDVGLKGEFEAKIKELSELKRTPVWIKNTKELIHTNLYQLYQDFILEKMWQNQDAHPHAPYDISFISPSGPFKKLSVTDCFNLQTYQDFTHVFLLQGKLPQREFRLRVPSRLLMEYGAGFLEATLVDLEQITGSGLLIRCCGKTFFHQMRPKQQVRLMFKSAPLDVFQGTKDFRESIATWSQNPFYSHNKQEAFILNCEDFQVASRFDFGETQDIYLFVSFTTLKSSHRLMGEKIERFIAKAKESMRSLLISKAA